MVDRQEIILILILILILLASPTGRDTATAFTSYCGPGTRSQFCGGRKPECPEKTLEVRLRLTQTQSTYNIVPRVVDFFFYYMIELL